MAHGVRVGFLFVAAGLTPVSVWSQVGSLQSSIPLSLPRAFNPVSNPTPQGGDSTAFPLYQINPRTPGASQAKCNDGSPVVYGYLPAKNRESKKWMLFLEGGSNCSNLFSCIQRWVETPDRMSTTVMPLSGGNPLSQRTVKPLSGIFLDTAVSGNIPNRFREEFHQVWVNYCSSDSWFGDGFYSDALSTAAGNGIADLFDAWSTQLISTPGYGALGRQLALSKASFISHFCSSGSQCTVYFRGKEIIDTVIEDLIRYRAMREPEVVLFAGSSAGSMGVRQNVDRITRRLSRLWPKVEVLGASDSGHYDAGNDILSASGALPSLSSQCTALPPLSSPPRPTVLPAIIKNGSEFWGDAITDFSCFRQEYGSVRPRPLTALAYQAMDSCRDHGLLLPAVSAPLFLFQAYRDRIYVGDAAVNAINCDMPAGLQANVTRASYNELFDSGRATFAVDSTLHTSMQSATFFTLTRRDTSVSSEPLSHYTTLWNWVESGGRYQHAILECPPGCSVACGQQRCP